jgi:hypothetical protein
MRAVILFTVHPMFTASSMLVTSGEWRKRSRTPLCRSVRSFVRGAHAWSVVSAWLIVLRGSWNV